MFSGIFGLHLLQKSRKSVKKIIVSKSNNYHHIDLVEIFPTVQTIQKVNTIWKIYPVLKFLLDRQTLQEQCHVAALEDATWIVRIDC